MSARAMVCCGSHIVLEDQGGNDPMDYQGKCEQCGTEWGLVNVTAAREELEMVEE